jgi:hypothetical protein
MPKLSGNCLCGATGYECNAEPLTAPIICHCTHCQKVSGSAFSVNVVLPAAAAVTWTGDGLGSFADRGDSGKSIVRRFCRTCGSSVAVEAEAFPGTVIIKAGSLDDRSWLKPGMHMWTRSAQPWVHIDPGVTVVADGG